MSDRNQLLHFEDILDVIIKIEKYTENISSDVFSSNSMIIDAVVRNVEIIGEASVKISNDSKDKYNAIPWIKLKGIRNRVVNDYFGVDVNIIWQIVQKDLASLKLQVEQVLKNK